MHAHPGVELVIEGHRTGTSDRRGRVLEACGNDGTSPFVVCWVDTGHTTILYPGNDDEIHRLEHPPAGPGEQTS